MISTSTIKLASYTPIAQTTDERPMERKGYDIKRNAQ